MRKLKEGSHKICGWNVFIDSDGKIVRGIAGTCFDYRPVFVYVWDRKYNCWCNVRGISVDSFRRGIKSGRVTMM